MGFGIIDMERSR